MVALNIRHSNDPVEILALVTQGYEPVECSIGGASIVGPLVMDHHGERSHLEGVAVRAYRDNFGVRRDDPRFVVTGNADADATFCIAALAGCLPHPSRTGEVKHPGMKGLARDVSSLADLVNKVDTAPIGVRVEEHPDGCYLLAHNQITRGAPQDALAFQGGVSLWRDILALPPSSPLLKATLAEEKERVFVARQATVERVGASVVLVQSDAWGFDVWYAEHAPIVVARTPMGNVTVGVRDGETAERLLGPGGLKSVFPKLLPSGWGGREAVGGSPRGLVLTLDQAREAARVVASLVKA